MIDSLTVIAEKNYNLILNPEDNKNSKEKEKLSNLRKSLINEYGDNYNNKNILKNIIQTKENKISKQKRMISDYNNQISNHTYERYRLLGYQVLLILLKYHCLLRSSGRK